MARCAPAAPVITPAALIAIANDIPSDSESTHPPPRWCPSAIARACRGPEFDAV